MTLLSLSIGYFALYAILALIVPGRTAVASPFCNWWARNFGTERLSCCCMAMLYLLFALAPLIASGVILL
jgi:hypothetical protein